MGSVNVVLIYVLQVCNYMCICIVSGECFSGIVTKRLKWILNRISQDQNNQQECELKQTLPF